MGLKKFFKSWRMTIIEGDEPMDFGRGNYGGSWWERAKADSSVEQPQALDLTDLNMVNKG
jgi:hypothetical protein